MIVHDSWWSNRSVRSAIIHYHVPFDQGLIYVLLNEEILGLQIMHLHMDAAFKMTTGYCLTFTPAWSDFKL